jgi:hypothetical protein
MTIPYLGQQPVTDFGQQFASIKYSVTLGATTDTTLTIPVTDQYYKAVIKVKNDTWVALNATAAVPGGSSFAATTSELVTPYEAVCREVKNGDVLHFYTATASTDVSVVLYATRHGTVGY